jgi:hypothetical protein
VAVRALSGSPLIGLGYSGCWPAAGYAARRS